MINWHTNTHIHTHISTLVTWRLVSPWWCRPSLPSVVGEQPQWQRSSTNDSTLIKSASNTYNCTVLLPWRWGDKTVGIYLIFVGCARSLATHANLCQSEPVWIGRTIYHNGFLGWTPTTPPCPPSCPCAATSESVKVDWSVWNLSTPQHADFYCCSWYLFHWSVSETDQHHFHVPALHIKILVFEWYQWHLYY